MSEDEKYIEDLIAQGEHGQQDFKFEISDSKKIAKSLVAFANTGGGRLLIGVKDNGCIAGVRSEEEYYMIEAAASMYSRPEVKFESFRRKVSGKTVLEIVVQASDHMPHFARDESGKWLAYHRVDDQNILASAIRLRVWKREQRERGTFIEYSKAEKKILDHLEDEGPASLGSICRAVDMKRRSVSNILVNLISIQALEMFHNGKHELYGLSNDNH